MIETTTTTPIRLNIGSGSTELDGFEQWDIAFGKHAFPLPHKDNTVDEIYSSHLLEYFAQQKAPDVLKEWCRVLKPGGRIRVAVPDFDRLQGHRDDPLFFNYIYGGQRQIEDQHRSGWTRGSLEALLKRNGIVGIKDFAPVTDDCTTYPFSLNLEGTKRLPFVVKEKPSVVACMSVGRLGFTDMFGATEASLAGCGIPLVAKHVVGSAFWEKSMTLAIQSAIKHHNPDYILTLDYDSWWTPEDVQQLFGIMQNNPEAAAVFPIQMHRAQQNVLCPSGEYEQPVVTAKHGHFGLTLFRREVFDELPHPWFWSVPAQDGQWEGPSVRDADIVFWDNLLQHGFKVLRANDVCIGHMELCVIWPDKDKALYQSIHDLKRFGKPKGVGWATPPKNEEAKVAV